MTTVGEIIEHMDRPRLTNGADPDTADALRHYDSIIDAWQYRGRESVGSPMTVRACLTTKGRPATGGNHGTRETGANSEILSQGRPRP